jgi:hypothetical protein
MNCHDTLLEIFNVIDNPTTLHRCRQVCKRWNSIILNSESHQKLFESLEKDLKYFLLHKNWGSAFACACGRGNIKIAKWLKVRRIEPNLIRRGFDSACVHGQLEIMIWLDKEMIWMMGITRPTKEYIFHKFRHACANGYFEVAKWLVQTFRLTNEDVRRKDIFVFQLVCFYGQLQIVQWLIQRFEFTAEDVQLNNNYAFRLAFGNKHKHVTDWLTKTYGIRAEDVIV